MKVEDNKKSHSYNVNEKVYQKAKIRALKKEGHLANLVESVVVAYGLGMDIQAIKISGDHTHAIDLFDIEPGYIATALRKFKKEGK